MEGSSPMVELRGITKRFPGVLACDHVDLQINSGEIHALLGENGAGKSTLMKILYGQYQPDAGGIWLDGRRMVMRSPKAAISAGIGMVFQDFTLIPSLTVAENIVLAVPKAGVVMRRKALLAHIQELAGHYELPVEPTCPMWQLSMGEQQRVEILKLLHRRARLLILDEPSAVLTPQEREAFLQGLRRLAAAGHAVMLITHKLAEALTVARRIPVLRHGRVAAQPDPAQVNQADLARLMVGGELPAPPARVLPSTAAVELSLTEVSAENDRGLLALRHISLEVQRGEIMGVAGVAGNGQRELAANAHSRMHRRRRLGAYSDGASGL